eukprot:g3420.t1
MRRRHKRRRRSRSRESLGTRKTVLGEISNQQTPLKRVHGPPLHHKLPHAVATPASSKISSSKPGFSREHLQTLDAETQKEILQGLEIRSSKRNPELAYYYNPETQESSWCSPAAVRDNILERMEKFKRAHALSKGDPSSPAEAPPKELMARIEVGRLAAGVGSVKKKRSGNLRTIALRRRIAKAYEAFPEPVKNCSVTKDPAAKKAAAVAAACATTAAEASIASVTKAEAWLLTVQLQQEQEQKQQAQEVSKNLYIAGGVATILLTTFVFGCYLIRR